MVLRTTPPPSVNPTLNCTHTINAHTHTYATTRCHNTTSRCNACDTDMYWVSVSCDKVHVIIMEYFVTIFNVRGVIEAVQWPYHCNLYWPL